ncbi:MAG: transposase, partial [Armatimonadetes bacterium]|nr:transposase [Armatimonadota bacterium]
MGTVRIGKDAVSRIAGRLNTELSAFRTRRLKMAYRNLLKGLIERGLIGVQLVISDDYESIKGAVQVELPSARWQRCVVHFQRNVLCHVPAADMGEVVGDWKGIFAALRSYPCLCFPMWNCLPAWSRRNLRAPSPSPDAVQSNHADSFLFWIQDRNAERVGTVAPLRAKRNRT